MRAWQHGPVRRVLVAFGINGLGTWFGEVALALLVLEQTGSVLAVTAVWVLAHVLPAFLGPALVARVRSLPALLGAQAALWSAIATCAATGAPVVALLVLAFLDGTAALGARAALKAVLVRTARPLGVEREAMDALGVVFTVGLAAGPVLAGVLVAHAGATTAFALDAASFVVAAVFLRTAVSAGEQRRRDAPGAVRAVLDHLRTDPALTRLLAAATAADVAFALIIPIEAAFVTRTLGADAGAFGLVLGAWGAGAIAGAAVVTRLPGTDRRVLAAAGTAFMVVGYAGMGLAPTVQVVLVASLVGGVGNGLDGCALLSFAQERTPDRLQLELGAVLESLRTLAPGVGFLLGGALAATTSTRVPYLVAAVGGLLVLPALLPRRTRQAPPSVVAPAGSVP